MFHAKRVKNLFHAKTRRRQDSQRQRHENIRTNRVIRVLVHVVVIQAGFKLESRFRQPENLLSRKDAKAQRMSNTRVKPGYPIASFGNDSTTSEACLGFLGVFASWRETGFRFSLRLGVELSTGFRPNDPRPDQYHLSSRQTRSSTENQASCRSA